MGAWRGRWLQHVVRKEQERVADTLNQYLWTAWVEHFPFLGIKEDEWVHHFAATYASYLDGKEVRAFMRGKLKPYAKYQELYGWVAHSRLTNRAHARKEKIRIRVINGRKDAPRPRRRSRAAAANESLPSPVLGIIILLLQIDMALLFHSVLLRSSDRCQYW